MIRANMAEILKKSRDKYTLVLMSSKAAKVLIQRDMETSNINPAPKDAYSLKDSSKHLSEAVKGIEEGYITLKTEEEKQIEAEADADAEVEEETTVQE